MIQVWTTESFRLGARASANWFRAPADELVTATINLDQSDETKQRWRFFARRNAEHYGAITEPVREALQEDHGTAPGRH